MKTALSSFLLFTWLGLTLTLGPLPPAPVQAAPGEDLYNSAVAWFAEEEYQLAAEKFEAFLKQFPQHPQAADALFKISFCWGKLDRFPEAAQSSARFVQQFPDDERAYAARYNIGYYYYRAGQFEPAAQAFQAYLEKAQSPDLTPRAWYWRGECLYELDRLEEAIAAYQTIIDQYPQALFTEGEKILPYALYSVAFCRFQQNRFEEARTAFLKLRDQLEETAPLQAEAHWYIAECYFRQSRFEEALKAYQEVQTRFSQSEFVPEAMLGQALCQLQLKQTDSAIQTLENLQGRYPHHPATQQAQVRLGDALLEAGRFAEARQKYLPLLQAEAEESPWHLDAVWGTAESYFREQNYAEAIPLYQRLATAQPPSPWAPDSLLREAYCYQAEKEFSQARALYTQFLETHAEAHPLKATAYLNRGVCSKEEGDVESAVQDFGAALAAGLDTENPEVGAGVRLEMGDYYLSQKDFEKAQQAYQKVAEYQPPGDLSGSGLLGLALVAEHQQRYAEAARLYEQFAEDYPNHPSFQEGLKGLGDMYAQLGQGEKAEEVRQRILEIDPESFPARLELAIAAYQKDEYARVLELLEPIRDQATPEDTSSIAFWNTLGAAYYQLQRWDSAAAAYGRLTTDFPASEEAAEALFWKAQAHRQGPQASAAKAALEKFLELHATHPRASEARFLLAQIYQETGAMEEADRLLQGLTEDPETAPDAWYEIAWACYNRGQKQEAREAWKKVLEQYPDSEKAPYSQLHIASGWFEEKHYEEAAQAYRSFLDRYPEHRMRGEAFYHLAWCQRAQGREEAARKSLAAAETALTQYLAAQREDPDPGELYYILGWARFDQQDFAGAAQAFEEATQRPGKRQEEASLRRGQALLQGTNAAAAREHLNAFLTAYPTSEWVPEALYYRGRAQLREAEWAGAEADFQRIQREFPGHEMALLAGLSLGILRQTQAEQASPGEAPALYEAAVQEYDRVLAQIPEAAQPLEAASEARYRKGECRYHQGQYKEALDEFNRTAFNASKYPHSRRWEARSRYMMGDCFVRLQENESAQKQFARAQEIFQELLEDPHLEASLRPEVLFYQGLVQRARGQIEEARTLWRQVVDHHPETEWAQRAQDQLTEQP